MEKNCWTEVVSRLDRYISFFWEVQEPRRIGRRATRIISLVKVFKGLYEFRNFIITEKEK